jgi:hypothetical protein
MTCGLLVALRGCRRGRWHDRNGGEKGKTMGIVGKDSRDSAKHPRITAETAKQHRAKKKNLEKLF